MDLVECKVCHCIMLWYAYEQHAVQHGISNDKILKCHYCFEYQWVDGVLDYTHMLRCCETICLDSTVVRTN